MKDIGGPPMEPGSKATESMIAGMVGWWHQLGRAVTLCRGGGQAVAELTSWPSLLLWMQNADQRRDQGSRLPSQCSN
jgi:hypothetical protein